jgi:hypothetical protein
MNPNLEDTNFYTYKHETNGVFFVMLQSNQILRKNLLKLKIF